MKQATLSFNENLSDSFYYTRDVSAALYIDLAQRRLQFFGDEILRGSKRGKKEIDFVSRNSPKFSDLQGHLEDLIWNGIGIGRFHHFSTLKEFNRWKWKEGIRYREIHWQVFLEEDDGSWLVCMNFDIDFPKELEALYAFAKSMNEYPDK